MHRSETRELTTCAACGGEIAPGRDRVYAFEPEGALCMACAIARGGRYDEAHDRWTRPPDTSDLPRSED